MKNKITEIAVWFQSGGERSPAAFRWAWLQYKPKTPMTPSSCGKWTLQCWQLTMALDGVFGGVGA
jgi:hypothetical protein